MTCEWAKKLIKTSEEFDLIYYEKINKIKIPKIKIPKKIQEDF